MNINEMIVKYKELVSYCLWEYFIANCRTNYNIIDAKYHVFDKFSGIKRQELNELFRKLICYEIDAYSIFKEEYDRMKEYNNKD